MSARRYCGEDCREGYRTDRRYGLIYGTVAFPTEDESALRAAGVPFARIGPDGITYADGTRGHHLTAKTPFLSVGWESACDYEGVCRYCRALIAGVEDTRGETE